MYIVRSDSFNEKLAAHKNLGDAIKDAIEWAAYDDITVSVYDRTRLVFLVDGALVADQLEMMIDNDVDTELN